MSAFATGSYNWLARLDEVANRLVHPAVTDDAVKAEQGRLIAVLLTAPFFVAAAAAQTLAPLFGIGIALAGMSAAFGAGWLIALLVASTGHDRVTGLAALAAGILAGAVVIAAAGGLASPLALLAIAFPVEAAFVRRQRRAVFAGSVATVLTVVLAEVTRQAYFPGNSVVAAHWLVPIAYACLVAMRAGRLFEARTAPETSDAALLPALLKGTVCFELDRNADVRRVDGDVGGLFGFTANLLYATGLFDRVHIADRVHLLCALADARTGAAVAPVELRIRIPADSLEGDRFQAFVAAFDGAAGSEMVTLVLRDNSVVADLRAALAKSVDAADESEIAKGRFLASVSHELRTPLNAIIGFSDMLLHEVACPLGDPKQQEYLELIRQSGSHLLGVVNSILDVSKIESGAYPIDPEPFRFAEAVSMSHSMMALLADAKPVRIVEKLAANIGEIHADRRAVHQILINLVSNAVKFTPAGGEVTIGAKRLGSRLHFWVADTGIGISEADLERVGQPFIQVQNDYTRQFEGTGLGLSVVKGLVALHDGTMSIESAPGEGTTVSISLPIFGPRQHSAEPRPLRMPMVRSDGERDAAIRKAG